MLMADLLTRPARSIVTQSYSSRERLQHNPLNGDGFGVGWYSDPSEDISKTEEPASPCVFTSVTPAWYICLLNNSSSLDLD
jgi:glutamine amidotransferase